MLETVIALSIMGTLTALAVPKVARSLDNVCVDYEIRCLHSTLHYTQSVSRISMYQLFRFDALPYYDANSIECYISQASALRYCVRTSGNSPKRFKGYYYLENGLKIINPIDARIKFGVNGELSQKGGTITISKGQCSRYLVLTNYGRIRISNQKS